MKKVLSLVLSVVLIIALLPAAVTVSVAAEEDCYGYDGRVISTKGHFEGATDSSLTAAGWTLDNATIASGDDAHAGTGYIQISGEGGSISFTVSGMSKGGYMLRGYYKHLNDGDAGASQIFMHQIGVASSNYNDALKYTTTWTRFGMMLNACQMEREGAISFSVNNGNGAATLCLDDLELIYLENYDTSNLVANPGFDINTVGTKSPSMYASWFNMGENEITDEAYTGDTALKMTSGRIYTWVNLPEKTTESAKYEFSARMKWSRAKQYLMGINSYDRPYISLESYSGNTVVYAKDYEISKANGINSVDWCYIKIVLDDESTPIGLTGFRLFLNGGTGYTHWDDVCIKKIDSTPEFLDETGTKIVQHVENAQDVSYTVRAHHASEKDGKLLLAAYKYDDNGEPKMISAGYAKLDKSGTSSLCKIDGVSAQEGENVVLKAYVWDGNMAPVTTKEIHNVNQDYGTVFEDGFEATTDWRPDNVSMEWVNAAMESTEVRSGSKALKLSGYNARAMFLYDGLLPGNEYTFSYWYKGTVDSGGGVTLIRHDWVNEADALAYVKSYESDGHFSQDDWTKVSYTFTHYEGTQLRIGPWIRYGTGTVYVDDMKLTRTKNSRAARISTDWVFYYTDFTGDGIATISLDPALADKGYTLNVSLEKDDVVLAEENDMVFENNLATFSFDLALMTQKTEEYRVVADIIDGDGKTVDSVYQQVYKFDRPSTMTKDGEFTDINGKKINPTFMYRIGYDDFATAASAGINVMQYSPAATVEETLAQLDEMYKMGVYAGFVCYWGMSPAGSASNHDRVRDFIEQIKHHPAIFCYMVMDEPFLNNSNAYDNLRKSYIMLRTADPARPTYICEGFAPYMKEVIKYCDVMAPDIYPAYSHASYATNVGDMFVLAEKYARGEKPLLAILQAFTQNASKPTATELHSMMYQAFLGGGNAVGFYTWEPDNPNVDVKISQGDYWPMLQEFYANEKTAVYDYYAYGKGTSFNGNRGEDIWYESWYDESGENIYMIVQNRHDDTKTSTSIPLVSADGKTTITDYTASIPGYGDDSTITSTSPGSIGVSLEPCQAVLIKVVLK